MTKVQHFDYMIIGQGLAGSAIALQLLKLRKRILVIDQPDLNTSSRIAAGLFNPITGRKLLKTWMADQLFPYLHKHYLGIEALTGERFYYPMPLYRPFLSISEQNEWMAKSDEEAYKPYIQNVFTRPSYSGINDVYGGLLLKQCGYIDTTRYLESVRKLIERGGVFVRDLAGENELSVTDDGARYKHYSANRLIFCNGTQTHRLFNWLPLRALKGETLRIKSLPRKELIINRGVYMVPAGQDDEWRVGATYNFKDQEKGATEHARQELVAKLRELVDLPFEILEQEWGFRPTTPDRRPILGRHPKLRSAFIFNGMGTKGVSLTPYFSEILIHSIENEVLLNKEVDIERYKVLYWSSST
jgi:glycine/D-amino acid oxidase-like deaminating enzyme